jgi:hypothetical protein
MFRNKTISAVRLALALAALPLVATAASAGSVQSAQIYYGSGVSAGSPSPSLYAPTGVGNLNNNVQTNYAPGNGGSQNFSGMTGGVNVQTNINNTKVINSSSNVSVNETINGSSVAYGLDGANALNVIDNANSEGANMHAQYTDQASQMESEALYVAQSMGY